MKDLMCRCAYPQEILIQFFFLNHALFELKNLTKMKDTTETVCQHNSSEAAQKNFVKLCSNDLKDLMCRLAYPQEILIQFFFWE